MHVAPFKQGLLPQSSENVLYYISDERKDQQKQMKAKDTGKHTYIRICSKISVKTLFMGGPSREVVDSQNLQKCRKDTILQISGR